ncbi:MAG: Sulfonate transport system substrate-binding protein [Caulobacter sp.]|nr:Sulfonate transport system substrate-binding protein [Caulobacter sp.]
MAPLRHLALIAAALGLLALPACSGKSAAGKADDAKIVRIVAGAATIGGKLEPSGLTGVVQDQGWLAGELAKKGYRLQFVDMPHAIGGPMINEGFVNKTVEFAFYGDLPAVIGASGGAPVRLVMPSNAATNTYLLVPTGSSAKSIADLKGKRVALHRGRPWEAVFARLIAANGLTINDFKIYNVNPSAGAAALAAGKVDGFVGPIADADHLTSQGVGKIIWSTKVAPKVWAQRTELFGRGDFIDQHKDIAQLVAASYVRAGQWASDPANRDAYIVTLSRETPEKAIRADLDGTGDWKARFSPLATQGLEDHYRNVIDYAAATGLISQKPAIGPLTDTSLVDPAVKIAGAEAYWSGAAKADALKAP